jgi:hypothetical protein
VGEGEGEGVGVGEGGGCGLCRVCLTLPATWLNNLSSTHPHPHPLRFLLGPPPRSPTMLARLPALRLVARP